MSPISNEFREHGIQKASSLGLHTSVKTTNNITLELLRTSNKSNINEYH